ncbi:MAG: D-aminoacyl-tRNA deacylase [Anaerolineae bacterium]
MRALLQRVSKASVSSEGEVLGRIDRGLVVLLGVGEGDGEEDVRYLAQKVAHLRIFPDEAGRFDRSLVDIEGQALVVSQFTLFGDTRKGRRPSFAAAARPEAAEPLVDSFVRQLSERGVVVRRGRFGAMMAVEIHNDGPVTLLLDSADRKRPRRG